MRPPRSALRAARTNNPHDLLVALRDRLAADLDDTADPRAAGYLAARLLDVTDRLAASAPTKEVSPLDELANRRRQANA